MAGNHNSMEKITLYYRHESTDKIYHATLEPKDSGYVVNFAYGVRGINLQAGTKTTGALDYGKAKAIYDKLVMEKLSVGYTPAGTDETGLQCQLLNTAEAGEVDQLLENAAYWMQEKYDGRRLLIRKEGETITGINRLGFRVDLPETLLKSVARYPIDLTIDGEAIGDELYAFDLLFIGRDDIRGERYGERFLRLMNLLASFSSRHIRLAETAFNLEQKTQLFRQLKERGCEGAVFKNIHASYIGGRPIAGGSQRKHKFAETASFIVSRITSGRSVTLVLFNGDRIAVAGDLKIPAHQELPQVGQVIECRYLYALKESGCIHEPVYLGVREDVRAEECTTAQLKFKPEQEERAA